MSHTRRHIIMSAIKPLFADPEIREALGQNQCNEIDAIFQKTEFSRRDVRKALHALLDASHSDE